MPYGHCHLGRGLMISVHELGSQGRDHHKAGVATVASG
jgi:hypothetical protein